MNPLSPSLSNVVSSELSEGTLPAEIRALYTSLTAPRERRPKVTVSDTVLRDISVVPHTKGPEITSDSTLSAPAGMGISGTFPATVITLSNGHRWVVFEERMMHPSNRRVWLGSWIHPSGLRRDETSYDVQEGRPVLPSEGVRSEAPSGLRYKVIFCAARHERFSKSRLVPSLLEVSSISSSFQRVVNTDGDSQRMRVSDFQVRHHGVLCWESFVPTSMLSRGMPVSYRHPFTRVHRVGFGPALSDGEISFPLERPEAQMWAKDSRLKPIGWARAIPETEWERFLNVLTGQYADDLFRTSPMDGKAARALLKK